MKKGITICLILATTFTVQAQTKEETISWLKEKFNKCVKKNFTYKDSSWSNRKLESINECEITFSYYFNNVKSSAIIPTKNIIISTWYKPERTINNLNKTIKISGENPEPIMHHVSSIEILECEDEIFERLQKAFDHLATFCPKKKETF